MRNSELSLFLFLIENNLVNCQEEIVALPALPFENIQAT
jgi:hypothetical protein